MNILLVNHYIGSPHYGMDFRPYYISREWVKMGHKVTMLGASQSHIRRIQPTVEDELTIEMIDGIQYVWIKTPAYDKSSSVKRIKNIINIKQLMANHQIEQFLPMKKLLQCEHDM